MDLKVNLNSIWNGNSKFISSFQFGKKNKIQKTKRSKSKKIKNNRFFFCLKIIWIFYRKNSFKFKSFWIQSIHPSFKLNFLVLIFILFYFIEKSLFDFVSPKNLIFKSDRTNLSKFYFFDHFLFSLTLIFFFSLHYSRL